MTLLEMFQKSSQLTSNICQVQTRLMLNTMNYASQAPCVIIIIGKFGFFFVDKGLVVNLLEFSFRQYSFGCGNKSTIPLYVFFFSTIGVQGQLSALYYLFILD